jgi:subtilisin family serine protease
MKDPFFGEDKKILPEVYNAYEEQGDVKVEVIIGVERGFETKDIIKKLKEMHVRKVKSTDRYVMAGLTKAQVKKHAEEKMVWRIWHNRPIKAMYKTSSATIKSAAASHVFKADGAGVTWAVLDTGIKADHKYFAENADSPPIVKESSQLHFKDGTSIKTDVKFNFITNETHEDLVGHGTHVAGIIRKMAPKTTICDFKVLGKNGGTSFSVIEAMYQIRKINFEARELVIHGANLSLGGPVPVGSYGCGFSPECQEANRLVDSGVVVCVAASNDGYKTFPTVVRGNELEYFSTFLDMGISDPGNAENVITVGSCHKTYPHKYGISWFSSKGPTGDGRFKPDVIAPGEKITSASIDPDNADGEEEMSGTSMATPHVSAAIAQFLSVKNEFIGCPDDIKKILMDTCTDIGRDRYFQGAGLIDVFRMIQSV